MSPKRQDVHFDDELVIYGETYYFRGTPEGSKKRIERSLGIQKGAMQKDVLRKKRDFLDSIERLGSSPGKNTFGLLAEKYISHREAEAKNPDEFSESSIKELRITMRKHLIPYFGISRIEEISQEDFDDYCKFKLKKKSYNFKNHLKGLNHFLGWCVQYKYLKYRPEVEIPKFAKKSHRERMVLTETEIKNLIKACEGPVLLYVFMYLFMGMRNMEICALRWDEIDLQSAALKVNPKNNRKRKARAIPINGFVLELLTRMKPNEVGSEYVFPSKVSTGKYPYISPQGGIRKPWFKALEKSGITRRITPHDLRATFKTFMHINTDFTDTQREKMAGSKIDVQKNTYVSMTVDHLRGLEKSVQFDGLNSIAKEKIKGITGGNPGGKKLKK